MSIYIFNNEASVRCDRRHQPLNLHVNIRLHRKYFFVLNAPAHMTETTPLELKPFICKAKILHHQQRYCNILYLQTENGLTNDPIEL